MHPLSLLSVSLLLTFVLALPPSNPSSMQPAAYQSLTCPQLAALNTQLDLLINYTYPPTVPSDKIYAVAYFTHSYKILINTIHHTDCVAETADNMSPASFPGNSQTVNNMMKSQAPILVRGDDDTTTQILCIVLDALLGNSDGSEEALPANGSGLVARQDSPGLVAQLLTLLGDILDVVLGCSE
ncbi:hypothetical protein BDW62DRAFT_200805 [Aspergillus aurantiobrunneus]